MISRHSGMRRDWNILWKTQDIFVIRLLFTILVITVGSAQNRNSFLKMILPSLPLNDYALVTNRAYSIISLEKHNKSTLVASSNHLFVLPSINTPILHHLKKNKNRMAPRTREAPGVAVLHHRRCERDRQRPLHPQRLRRLALLHPQQSDQRGLRQRVSQHRHGEDLLYLRHAHRR